jgi:hypothetical protein
MIFGTFPEDLALAAGLGGILLSLLLSIFALVRSKDALSAAIPAPEVQPAYRDYFIVRMRPVEDKRFGISALSARGGIFSAMSDFSLRDLESALRGSAVMGVPTSHKKYTPTAVSLLVKTSLEADGSLWAKISCRDDAALSRWVRLL